MTDSENPNLEKDLEEEKEGDGKGKGDKTDAGALGRAEVDVGEGFYATMAQFGTPVSQIAEILKAWRHLKGKGLLQAIKDFAGRRARASAHAEVEIEKGKDFSLLQNVLKHFKSLRETPDLEQVQKHQADAQNRQKGPGSHGPSI